MRTSYSRRELYALGEPLGDSATYLKADGGLILGDGGGGGGSQPASSTTQTQDLPDWAKPYAQDVLSKGKAVTDLDQNPYQPYGGNRIAGFDPMQQQAFQGAQNMRVAPQIGQATAASVGAGLGGFDVAGQANQYGFQNQVGGYMNPYLQMSLALKLLKPIVRTTLLELSNNLRLLKQAHLVGHAKQSWRLRTSATAIWV